MKWKTGIAVLFFLGLVWFIRDPQLVDDFYTQAGIVQEEQVFVPDESVASGFVESTPGAIPTPRSVPKSELTIEDLKILALSYINTDRAIHGLDPVTLNDNGAAQSHADDMLDGRYLGHWWRDGSKPYMVYSALDGDSYVSENAARTGFSEAEYNEHCSRRFVVCEKVDPSEDIERLQYLMMYDDAESDWGHRDNILNPDHRKVSIGVAYSDHFLAFVQHFEGGTVTAIEGPNIDSKGRLTLKAQVNEPDFELFDAITVHREELPTSKRVEDIEELHSYCVGGEFTESCGDPIARILPPPPKGKRYIDLPVDAHVASIWSYKDGIIEIDSKIGSVAMRPGVYTITIYRDGQWGASDGAVYQLSVVVLESKQVALR